MATSGRYKNWCKYISAQVIVHTVCINCCISNMLADSLIPRNLGDLMISTMKDIYSTTIQSSPPSPSTTS